MGKIKTFYHDDDRRMLVEWIPDIPVRTCKAFFIKKDAILGNHYHNLTEDIFFLLKGSGYYYLDGKEHKFKEGQCIRVKKGVGHTLHLTKGSILLEASTLPYDKKDEHPLQRVRRKIC